MDLFNTSIYRAFAPKTHASGVPETPCERYQRCCIAFRGTGHRRTSDWQKNNTGSLPATITFGTTLKNTNLAMPTVFVQWMVLMGLSAPGTRPCIWTRPKRCRNS
ncbi:hypothetical protein MCOR12_003072 [Pyricularia oryzae]|nr:hypothetical protein MCOR12_003072 [Pyricularia oryzae]